MKHIVHLLSSSPLEIFYISSVFVGLSFNSLVEDELWTQLILTHGKRLLEFHVSRILIGWEMIQSIDASVFNVSSWRFSVFVEPDDVVRTLASFLLRLEGLVFQNINIFRPG